MDDIKVYAESLRKELKELIDNFKDCNKEKLLEISRKLDKAICEYIKTNSDC